MLIKMLIQNKTQGYIIIHKWCSQCITKYEDYHENQEQYATCTHYYENVNRITKYEYKWIFTIKQGKQAYQVVIHFSNHF